MTSEPGGTPPDAALFQADSRLTRDEFLRSPEEEFKGLVAVVTGVSRPNGIGRFLAAGLAAGGAEGVVFNSTDSEASRKFAENRMDELAGLGTKPIWVPGDLAEESTAIEIIDKAKEEFGKVDILVCNAGLTTDVALTRLTTEIWDRVMNVNARSAFILFRESVKRGGFPRTTREKRGGGSVVLIGSPAGEHGSAGQLDYDMSKGALRALNQHIALDFGRRDIRSNLVSPGRVGTDMGNSMPEGAPQMVRDATFLGVDPSQKDIMEAVLFCAGPRSSAMTGQEITVDGGLGGGIKAIPGLMREKYAPPQKVVN
jgi:3-oxoacyl-[acyl-carrier protein] reductase